jgi:lipid II isoglutaminyl synthase (glutamine-hydrolysing)
LRRSSSSWARTRLIATLLERATGSAPVTNRSGANLTQGIVTAMLAERPRDAQWLPGVFEVDELAFRRVAAELRPNVVVILNLLRDQLDRYGEIDAIAERWREDLASLPAGATLVTCGDDPRVEAVARQAGRRVVRFGLAQTPRRSTAPDAAGSHPESRQRDAAPCPACGHPIRASTETASGLGPWRCRKCGAERPRLDLEVQIEGTDDEGWLVLRLGGPFVHGPSSRPVDPIRVRLSGAAGAYDAAAAVLTSIVLGIEPRTAIGAVDLATAAFGRLEELDVDDRRVVLTLAKNPASLAEAAEAVRARRPDGLLFGLADRPADGRDVSWIWDAPVELLRDQAPLTVTGNRAEDLALRLKYADGGSAHPFGPPLVDPSPERALDSSLRRVRPGGTLIVLGTYTALLGIRMILERRGLAPDLPR